VEGSVDVQDARLQGSNDTKVDNRGCARDTCGSWQGENVQRRRRCRGRWCATSRTMGRHGSALWLTIEDRDDGWRRAKREFTHSRFARNVPTH